MKPDKQIGKRIMMFLIAIVLLSSVYVDLATAEVNGILSINVTNSTRRAATAASSLNAIAGNVSKLNIIGETVTQSWQGYYGNITGTIVLSDSADNYIYAWNVTSPEGEIYAAQNPIDFSSGNIDCYNFTKTGDGYFTLAKLENSLGIAMHDSDGVNETFNKWLTHESFYAGDNYIYGGNGVTACPTVRLFNSSRQSGQGIFEEVLLYDTTNNQVVYTALIESDQLGFNNYPWDFEMIVGEDGHRGNTTTTQYYFYIELS